MNAETIKLLGDAFPFEAVEAKIQVVSKDKSNTGMAVFYLDARAIQNRLDDVLGHFGWKNQYVTWHGDAQLCGIAIYNLERKEWVGKFDGAECSKIEPIKGGLTDSFKRAACMWGIGRYLYEIPGVWVEVEQRGNSTVIVKNQMGKLKAEYEAAVKKIFGLEAYQKITGGKGAGGSPSSTHSQPTNNQQNQQPASPAGQENPRNNQPPNTPQHTNVRPQPPTTQTHGNEQVAQRDVLSAHDFIVQNITQSGQKSKLLELRNHAGAITTAYISADEQGIVVGNSLLNVKLDRKTGQHGVYNLITNYELAA